MCIKNCQLVAERKQPIIAYKVAIISGDDIILPHFFPDKTEYKMGEVQFTEQTKDEILCGRGFNSYANLTGVYTHCVRHGLISIQGPSRACEEWNGRPCWNGTGPIYKKYKDVENWEFGIFKVSLRGKVAVGVADLRSVVTNNEDIVAYSSSGIKFLKKLNNFEVLQKEIVKHDNYQIKRIKQIELREKRKLKQGMQLAKDGDGDKS